MMVRGIRECDTGSDDCTSKSCSIKVLIHILCEQLSEVLRRIHTGHRRLSRPWVLVCAQVNEHDVSVTRQCVWDRICKLK